MLSRAATLALVGFVASSTIALARGIGCPDLPAYARAQGTLTMGEGACNMTIDEARRIVARERPDLYGPVPARRASITGRRARVNATSRISTPRNQEITMLSRATFAAFVLAGVIVSPDTSFAFGGPGCPDLPSYARAVGTIEMGEGACGMTMAEARRILAHGDPDQAGEQAPPPPRAHHRRHRLKPIR